MKNLLRLSSIGCAALVFASPTLAQSQTSKWSGFYIGAHLGYGWGDVTLDIPQSGGTTTTVTTTNCLDSLGRDYTLIAPPAGSVFDSAATGNQSYVATPAFAAALGLVETAPGSNLFVPSNRVAFDYPPTDPVAADECIAHNAYALGTDGNYYGGTLDASQTGNAIVPPGLRPGDINGTINSTTTTTTTTTADLGPFAAAVVDPATLAALAALPGTSLTIETEGFIGGVQAGWNYLPSSKLLIGIETDFAITSVDGITRIGSASAAAQMDWFGTIRGRVGTVSGAWLVYLTGGLAYGDGEITYQAGGISVSQSHTLVGYTIGGGAEVALSDDLTIKAEYKYLDFGSDTYSGGTSFDVKGQFVMNAVTIGLNYRY